MEKCIHKGFTSILSCHHLFLHIPCRFRRRTVRDERGKSHWTAAWQLSITPPLRRRGLRGGVPGGTCPPGHSGGGEDLAYPTGGGRHQQLSQRGSHDCPVRASTYCAHAGLRYRENGAVSGDELCP